MASGKRPFRRELWSLICFFLAVLSSMGLMQVRAIFIDAFSAGMRGLLGMGYYLVPISLFAASYILLFHHGRPVRHRVLSVFLLNGVLASMLHLFINKIDYPGGLALISSLYLDGQDLTSGGVLGGLTAIVLKLVFSKPGGAFLLIGLTLFLLTQVLNTNLAKWIEWIFRRERPEYEEEPEPVVVKEPVPAAVESPKPKPVIDIPMDDAPAQKPASKHGLFRRKPSEIKSPDELLLEGAVQASANKTSVDAEPAGASAGPASEEPAPVKEQTDAAKAQEEAIQREIISEIEAAIENEGNPSYVVPSTDLLLQGGKANSGDSVAELKLNAQRLIETITSFGIEARLINVTRGPSVTRFEMELDRGVKLMKLTGLADDIALSLGASGVRIAPIPDKVAVVGIEVPNKIVSPVPIRDVLETKEFTAKRSKVAFALGRNIAGESIVGDIGSLPHLLIAGTTGSGKSVCMNALIISLLYKASPDEVRLIMIDPKMIELNIYNGIPHLLIPVVTDPRKASGALQWAVTEMMNRYKLFSAQNVRDIHQYNEVALSNPEIDRLPQIVIVIDELADLMLVAAKEVEESVCRIAQMARAAGMHLIIATQRPSADVITGIMKANIPSRISFAVASQLESRIILDTTGAEKLVGKGDMLYYPLGAGKPMRVQGCLITSAEVERVVEFVKKSGKADYSDEVLEHIERSATEPAQKNGASTADTLSDVDELLPQAVEVILETGQASVSMLQRRLKLGYARAARLVDQLESRGIVGPFEGAKPRQLLITKEQWEEMKMQNPNYG